MAETSLAPTFEALSRELAALVSSSQSKLVLVHARAGRPIHGVIVDSDLVLTLDHALEREDAIRIVAAEGGPRDATVAGRDPASNLAALRVPGLGLEPFQSATGVHAGQLVLAVGRHGGAPLASVTTIRSVGGPVRGWRGAAIDSIVRTDGVYGPAFAGAPLVDASGRLAAIVPAGEWRTAGFAIPGQHATTIARTLARDGSIPRGYLGIQCYAVGIPARQREEGTASRGLLVVSVAERSAADRGGLLVGDIVVRVAGEDVQSPEQLHAMLARTPAGSTHPVVVVRGSTRQTLDITLGRRL